MFDIVVDLILEFVKIVPVFLIIFMFAGLVSTWTK